MTSSSSSRISNSFAAALSARTSSWPRGEAGNVKTKTHFACRVDVWDAAGDNIVEHIAGVDDFETAVATYRARWPKAKITLRQGARVVKKNWA
jgi:hypothetical protein